MSSPKPLIIGVVRSGGGPVPLARVFLESAPGPIPDVALLTDADGRFTIGTVGPGSYRLAIHSDNHHPATATVEVGTHDTTIEVLMEPTT